MHLKQLLEEHKKLKFPPFPRNDDFALWVEELAELDGYYVGLTVSYLGGEKKSVNIGYFEKAKKELPQFASSEVDAGVYNICSKYLASLEKLIFKLKE